LNDFNFLILIFIVHSNIIGVDQLNAADSEIKLTHHYINDLELYERGHQQLQHTRA
jgi:hypothetical protein